MQLVEAVEIHEHSDSPGWIISIITAPIHGVYFVETQRGGCHVFKDLETVAKFLRLAGLNIAILYLQKKAP